MGTLAQPLIATPPWHGLGGTGTRQQVINRLASFPISTPGACQLRLMVKTARDTDFRALASVLIVLRHARA